MSGSFRVSLDELAAVVERMANFDRIVADTMARVEAGAAALATTWTGAAAATYEETHERWVADLAAMQTAVQHLRTNAATAHGNYSAAVDAGRRMWG